LDFFFFYAGANSGSALESKIIFREKSKMKALPAKNQIFFFAPNPLYIITSAPAINKKLTQ